LDPRRLNSELSDEFVEVIADMMAKDLSERIPTTADVIARLAPWVDGNAPAISSKLQASAAAPAAFDPAPPRRPVAPTSGGSRMISDTEPNFLVQPIDDPGQGESPSQMSLGTQPMAQGSSETLPLFPSDGRRIDWNAQGGELSILVKLLVVVGILFALGTFAAVVIYTALSG
jgi:hypothetical protein